MTLKTRDIKKKKEKLETWEFKGIVEMQKLENKK